MINYSMLYKNNWYLTHVLQTSFCGNFNQMFQELCTYLASYDII